MKLGGWALVAAVAGGVFLRAEGAAAQDAAPVAPAAASADIVRLKNGGLLRGTISELVPGETVIIVTASGKTREISMSEVDYAGPADQDPTAAPASAPKKPDSDAGDEDEDEDKNERSRDKARPYVTVRARKARLFLESEPSGITFHRQTGTATAGSVSAVGFDRLCTAPCTIELPAGTEELSLSLEDGKPANSRAVTIPEGESTIVGRYEDNSGMRIGAIVSLIVGLGGGTALMLSGASTDDGGPNGTLMGIGGAVMGAGCLVSAILFTQGGDEATFEVLPRGSMGVSWPKAKMLRLSGSF